LTDPFHKLSLYAHYTGNHYIYVSEMINLYILKELQLLCDEISAVLKDVTGTEKYIQKDLESSDVTAKTSKTDNIKLKTTSDAQIEDLFQKKGSLSFKNWLKISNSVHASDFTHKISILNQESSHEAYHQSMSDIMDTFEELELKRVNVMKESMLEYTKLMKELGDEIKKRNQILLDSAKAMSEDLEIKEFIISLKTGKEKDSYMKFEPYQIQKLE
jgi:hypothetical protein